MYRYVLYTAPKILFEILDQGCQMLKSKIRQGGPKRQKIPPQNHHTFPLKKATKSATKVFSAFGKSPFFIKSSKETSFTFTKFHINHIRFLVSM